MSRPWLPFGSFLSRVPGMESPPCPCFCCGGGDSCPLARLRLGCSPQSEHYCWDKVMWVQAGLAGWAHVGYPSIDAEAQPQVWMPGSEVRPLRFMFSEYFFVAVEPGCCSDIFPGSQVLIPCSYHARGIHVKKVVCDGGGKEEIHVKRGKGDAESEAERFCQVVLLCR